MDLELLYKSLFGCFLVSTNPKTDFRPYEVFFRQIQIPIFGSFFGKKDSLKNPNPDLRCFIHMQIKGSEVTPLNQGKRGTTESIEAVLDD